MSSPAWYVFCCTYWVSKLCVVRMLSSQFLSCPPWCLAGLFLKWCWVGSSNQESFRRFTVHNKDLAFQQENPLRPHVFVRVVFVVRNVEEFPKAFDFKCFMLFHVSVVVHVSSTPNVKDETHTKSSAPEASHASLIRVDPPTENTAYKLDGNSE